MSLDCRIIYYGEPSIFVSHANSSCVKARIGNEQGDEWYSNLRPVPGHSSSSPSHQIPPVMIPVRLLRATPYICRMLCSYLVHSADTWTSTIRINATCTELRMRQSSQQNMRSVDVRRRCACTKTAGLTCALSLRSGHRISRSRSAAAIEAGVKNVNWTVMGVTNVNRTATSDDSEQFTSSCNLRRREAFRNRPPYHAVFLT
jgi:hypothetical protein